MTFASPFALLYFYLVFASAFNWPKVGTELFSNEIIQWVGVVLCILALIFIFLSLISFGKSFRIGIDLDHPGTLVTTGTLPSAATRSIPHLLLFCWGYF